MHKRWLSDSLSTEPGWFAETMSRAPSGAEVLTASESVLAFF